MASTTESIAAEVRAALARPRPRLGATDVARVLNCSTSAASRKLNGRVAFKVADLARIAELLDDDPEKQREIVAGFYSSDPASVPVQSPSVYTDVA